MLLGELLKMVDDGLLGELNTGGGNWNADASAEDEAMGGGRCRAGCGENSAAEGVLTRDTCSYRWGK